LIRVEFGPFALGDIGRGQVREVPRKETEKLARSLPDIDANRRR
jgi:16S rRNA U516 pseudouridylate synthase RsuA-like enzyme